MMPAGAWRRRPPLPPTEGTTVVCPIGEAMPETAEEYRRERDAVEPDPDYPDVSGGGVPYPPAVPPDHPFDAVPAAPQPADETD